MAVENGDSSSTKEQVTGDWPSINHDTYQVIRAAQKDLRRVQSNHEHSRRVSSKLAARCKARILTACDYLDIEIKEHSDEEPLDEIWESWQDNVHRLEDVNFRYECPGFVIDFMYDVRVAAWERGYIRPHTFTQADPEDDAAMVREAIE